MHLEVGRNETKLVDVIALAAFKLGHSTPIDFLEQCAQDERIPEQTAQAHIASYQESLLTSILYTPFFARKALQEADFLKPNVSGPKRLSKEGPPVEIKKKVKKIHLDVRRPPQYRRR